MKRLIYPALFGLALAGCSQNRSEQELAISPQNTVRQVVITQEPTPPAVTTASVMATVRPLDPRIIYQGELNLAVDDFEQTSPSINRLLVQHGSYLSTAHEERASGQQRQEMTVKVPPTEFAALVAALKSVDSGDAIFGDAPPRIKRPGMAPHRATHAGPAGHERRNGSR